MRGDRNFKGSDSSDPSVYFLFCGLVMSKLYYCSTVWSNTSTTNINKLQAVQNFAVRIITNTRKYDHITPVLSSIGWLPVKKHLEYRDSLMTYKCMKGLAPPYLCNLFLTRSDVHNVNTRNKDMLHVPQYKTASGQRSFRYRAVKIWNTTDDNLKNLPFGTFKSKLKDKMLAETF